MDLQGEHMQIRCQRLILAVIVLLGADVGVARQALAQAIGVTFTGFPIPTANSSPGGITTGPDGAGWFTENNGKIGRVTTAGVITELTIPTANSGPQGITAGPDGALWFTNDDGASIGRITVAGAVTTYTSFGIKNPFGITAGPDGAVWFTNSNSSIGRITTPS